MTEMLDYTHQKGLITDAQYKSLKAEYIKITPQANIYIIVPFRQVGQLKFGMTREEVATILGPFARESKTFTGRIAEFRENISTKYKKDKLNEISFLPGAKLLLDDYNLLEQKGVDYIMNKYNHESDLGFTVFPELGLAFTGFGKSKDAKTVSCFTKAVLKEYLAT